MIEPETVRPLGLLMAGPKSVFEIVRIWKAEIAAESIETTSSGDKGLFICRHNYLCKQLLLQINSSCFGWCLLVYEW